MTVVKDDIESVAKLSGKQKKKRLKVRDHGQEEGKVSDKSKKICCEKNNSRTCLNHHACHQRERSVESIF